jgi:PKD repeat protein
LLTAATAINEQGDIVGTGITEGEVHGFLLSNAAPPPPGDNQSPVAVASTDVTSGKAPLEVIFSAAGSTDPDGDTLSFEWVFGDGQSGSGDTVTVVHTYTEPGTYIAQLTVTDGGGMSDAASVEIRVRKGRSGK